MMEERMSNKANLALLIGFIAYVFSGGRWNVGITAWIWPFAFLYFSRKTEGKKSFLLLVAALAAGHVLKWLNILDSGYFLDAAVCLIWSLAWIIPFMADRLVAQKLPGVFLRSLVFPALFSSVEVLLAFSPISSLGTMAYTQEGFLPLLQIASVIGSFRLSFLIFWFGTVAITAVEKRPGWKRLAVAYLSVIVVVFIFGCTRLASYPADADKTVRVAGIVGPYYEKYADGSYAELSYDETERYLVSEAQRAADSGAAIACWNEEAFSVDDTEEARLIQTAKMLAKEHEMILIPGIEVNDTDGSEGGLTINKSVIVLPDGALYEYIKTNLVPLIEASYVKGTGEIPTVMTDLGIISNVICFDETYIGFVHGMGANTNSQFKNTDILFVPSWDWDSIKNAHTRMAAFRAIENGEAIVKPTYGGISAAVDPFGRELLRLDTADTGFDTVWFAEVPVAEVRTIYSIIGTGVDLALCALGPILLLLCLLVKRQKIINEY